MHVYWDLIQECAVFSLHNKLYFEMRKDEPRVASGVLTNIGQLKTVVFPRAFVPELDMVCCDVLLKQICSIYHSDDPHLGQFLWHTRTSHGGCTQRGHRWMISQLSEGLEPFNLTVAVITHDPQLVIIGYMSRYCWSYQDFQPCATP